MFAGPNGSGKSTLKSVLPKELLGVYLNPDDIEKEIRETGFLDFSSYGVVTTADEVLGILPEGKRTWLAEITDGRELELKTDQIPAWFKQAVLDKILPPS